ncbi:class IIb bacteriocin, lactobin A/cerein 7B family [Cylindrospermopsis raciborskii]|jgi:lactobin A/cerein 7B family class IIb bacteriocin|uniref:class IIb bacteriocin, lactobin A/cerein 7B family n=1 Tax=Cylindrospermopsis raciborskii TaxID=77022 RepID=UPI001F2F071D|nr:class IIb bacteriocin, lactobin A/cerein 7B family [Cylindrospermopsis raciborskii]UJS05377.1 class IIb bacteriocin, lactobin A/cerein 7B family [Cylindrospermopsis raciborskii KLL07]
MANISISDLRPAGVDFFSDSESFLDDLNDNELYNVSGGSPLLVPLGLAVILLIGVVVVAVVMSKIK